MNLWNPEHLTMGLALVTAFVLGIIHGLTPDEHTWPITFSYAIGGYSTRRGLRMGLLFSLAFTLQRALASELAFLGLVSFMAVRTNSWVWLAVGVVMLWGGWRIFRSPRPRAAGMPPEPVLRDAKPWMPLVHGFVAGWGFGAFALIIYTVLAPAMPSAAWGWVPGALFGLGTTLVQALAGAGFGWWAASRGVSAEDLRRAALRTAGRTLKWGGLAFIAAAAVTLLIPAAGHLAISTGIRVHNLAHLGLAFLLVIVIVLGVGMGSFALEIRRLPLSPPFRTRGDLHEP
jgi:nitrate reductase gamma subunit